jgi:hypothetical protein
MVTPFRLNLTRDQLAMFLQDHEQIKQFEKLFQIVDTINTVTLDDVSVSAGNAGASANEALSQVEALQSLVQLLAYAPEAPTQSDIAALQDQITALQQQPPPKEFRTPRFGSFYDTTTQTAAAINTAYAMTINTTDLSQGVYIGSPASRIYVDRPNVYNVQFSAQLDKTTGGTGLVWIWLRKNGVDVPDSTGFVRLQGNNAELLAAWNYLVQLNAGDYIEIMWEVDDTSVQILYEAATAVHPATPSVIVTVSDNISSMEV